MRRSRAKDVEEMERRILEGPGELDPSIRRAAVAGDPLDDPQVERYARMVRLHAYRITDEQVDGLRAAGWSEDQIFELTIAAAYGAGKRRLDAGLRALGPTPAMEVAD